MRPSLALELLRNPAARQAYKKSLSAIGNAFISPGMLSDLKSEAALQALGRGTKVKSPGLLRPKKSLRGLSDPAIMAHELGHAANAERVFNNKPLRKLRNTALYGPAIGSASSLIGSLVGLGSPTLSAVAAAAHLPRLLEEGAASARAISSLRKARKAGVHDVGGSGAGRLAAALGTYLGAAGTDVAIGSPSGWKGRIPAMLGSIAGTVGSGGLAKKLVSSPKARREVSLDMFKSLGADMRSGNPYLVRGKGGPLRSSFIRLDPSVGLEDREQIARLLGRIVDDPRDARKLTSRQGAVVLGYHG